MEKYKTFFLNITASIIASILVILFHEPVFSLISSSWHWLQDATISVITGFSDSATDKYYQLCSNSYTRGDAAAITIWIGLTLYIFLLANKFLTETLIQKLQHNLLTDDVSFLTLNLFKTLGIKIPLFMMVIVFAISIFSIMSSGKEYDDFRESLTVLSPHLNEKQEDELKAAWVLMKNKADFDNIQLEIKSYSEQFNINLPNKTLNRTFGADTPRAG